MATEVQYREKPCPDCGGKVEVRSNRSARCKECYHDRYNRTSCPRCGGKMRKTSTLCASCLDAAVAAPRKMSETEIAWVAGILEGEGYFSRTRSRIHCTMTDRDIIERLRAITGVGSTIYDQPGQQEHHKPWSMWYVARQEHVAHLAQALLPWLGVRRRAAANALIERYGAP